MKTQAGRLVARGGSGSKLSNEQLGGWRGRWAEMKAPLAWRSVCLLGLAIVVGGCSAKARYERETKAIEKELTAVLGEMARLRQEVKQGRLGVQEYREQAVKEVLKLTQLADRIARVPVPQEYVGHEVWLASISSTISSAREEPLVVRMATLPEKVAEAARRYFPNGEVTSVSISSGTGGLSVRLDWWPNALHDGNLQTVLNGGAKDWGFARLYVWVFVYGLEERPDIRIVPPLDRGTSRFKIGVSPFFRVGIETGIRGQVASFTLRIKRREEVPAAYDRFGKLISLAGTKEKMLWEVGMFRRPEHGQFDWSGLVDIATFEGLVASSIHFSGSDPP